MGNKKSGTSFEHEVAQLLSDMGFWVHRLQDNSNGQPFDIIAAKEDVCVAVECKVCEDGWFDLRRVEENQNMAFDMFLLKGNKNAFFAFKGKNGAVTFAPYVIMRNLIACNGKGFDTSLGLCKEVFECIVMGDKYASIHKQ
jgi:Holliday junction resolvase